MQMKTLNDPSTGTEDTFIEAINESGAALAHGDVVVRKMTTLALGQTVSVTTSTSANDPAILGVIHDPNGDGIADGGVCRVQVRGYHPAVKILSTVTPAFGNILTNSTTAKKCTNAVGATVAYTVNFFGYALATAAATTIPVLIGKQNT